MKKKKKPTQKQLLRKITAMWDGNGWSGAKKQQQYLYTITKNHNKREYLRRFEQNRAESSMIGYNGLAG